MPQLIGDQVIDLFAVLWCFFCAWAIILLLSWSLWTTIIKGVQHLKRLHGVPCSNCAYFTGDYHLKCTVHPTIALSEQAISCSDFEQLMAARKSVPQRAHKN
jgi:hypothetical protein